MAKLAPIINNAQFINGIPASGAKIFTYANNSSTKQIAWADEAGTIPQTNPIILNARGEPDQAVWLTEGLEYELVFAPSTDTDPPTSPIWNRPDITGINDASLTIEQWVDSGLTPTYVSATQFTLAGDQTTAFANKRRFKALVTAGTVYGTIYSAVFGALTTVTVVMDAGQALDSGLSSIQLSLLTPGNTAIPSIVEDFRATVAATATTTPLWVSTAKVQDWTGTPTITDLPQAPQAGATRIVYPTAGTIFTDNAAISVQGGATYTSVAEDRITITAVTTTTFQIDISKGDGTAISTSFADATTYNTGTDETQALNSKIVRENTVVNAAVQSLGSGTTKDFTGIPAWAKKITISIVNASSNGTSLFMFQVGTSSGFVTTGYTSTSTVSTTSVLTAQATTGFVVYDNSPAAGDATQGAITLTLVNPSSNTWVATGIFSQLTAAQCTYLAGTIGLAGSLDRVKLTTVNGTDAFDSGTVNIQYE